MKNMKRSLAALAIFATTSSFANLLQPGVPAREDTPIRVTIGTTTDLVTRPKGNFEGFGLESWNGGLGFSHNVGYGFEYGLSAALGYRSVGGKLFDKKSADANKGGLDLNAEVMLRFMPEVADGFNLGLYADVGFNKFFYNEKEARFKANAEMVSFGDLHVHVGPAVSLHFTEMFAMYLNPNFAISSIRFYKDDKIPGDDEVKKNFKAAYSNLMGFQIPVGAKIDFSENCGLVLEYAAKINNPFGKTDDGKTKVEFADQFAHGVTLALSYDF